MLAEAALAVMLAQSPPDGATESAAERAERLGTIAQAVALEAASPPPGWPWGPRELAALLLATTYEESQHWRLEVHRGSRMGDGGRARCLAQLHRHPRWMPRELWRASAGTDLEATRVCLAGAARVLGYYAATCVSTWRATSDLEGSFARVVAGYGSGRSCNPTGRPWALRRARRAARWAGELWD